MIQSGEGLGLAGSCQEASRHLYSDGKGRSMHGNVVAGPLAFTTWRARLASRQHWPEQDQQNMTMNDGDVVTRISINAMLDACEKSRNIDLEV